MNYSLITEEQLEKRFRGAPEKIKDLLESEKVQTEVARICEANRLDEERALIVSQLAGLVLLGFVPERIVSLELGEQAHMNFLHANAIAKELEEKVFTPVAEELKAIYKHISDNITPTTRMDAGNANEEEKDETEISINKETAEMIDARIKEGEEKKEGGVDNWIKKLKGEEDQPVLLYKEKAPETKGKEFAKFSLPFGLFARKTAAAVIPLKAEIESGDGERKTIGEIVGRNDTNIQMNVSDTNGEEKKKESGNPSTAFRAGIWGLKGREKRVVHYSGARTPILAYEDDLFQDETPKTRTNAGNANGDEEGGKVEKLKDATQITPIRANDTNRDAEGLGVRDKDEKDGGLRAEKLKREDQEGKNVEKLKREDEEKKEEDGKNEFKGKIQKPRPMMMGNTVYLK